MTALDKTFCKALGQRIAQDRKERALTQMQLAEKLGIAPQRAAAYRSA